MLKFLFLLFIIFMIFFLFRVLNMVLGLRNLNKRMEKERKNHSPEDGKRNESSKTIELKKDQYKVE